MISDFYPTFKYFNINGKESKYGVLKDVFKIGDRIDVTIHVTSPNNCKIFYALCNEGESPKDKWVESNHFVITIDGNEYGKIIKGIYFKSDYDYHMHDKDGYDGLVALSYIVVPNK